MTSDTYIEGKVREFQSKYSFDWSSDVIDNFRQSLTEAYNKKKGGGRMRKVSTVSP